MKAMLEHASLTPEALAYFRALPLGTQVAISHSNLSFRTLEDIKDMLRHGRRALQKPA